MPLLSEILTNRIGEKSGRSKAYIADALGVTEKTIENYMHGKRQPKPKALVQLSKILGFSLDELSEQNVPRETYTQQRRNLKNGESVGNIKIYESARVYATVKNVYHDEHAVPDYVLNIPQFRDCNYGTRASGDSMYPEIRNGDLIICKELDRNARIIFGDIYIVHTKDDIETIKYIQKHDDPDWINLVPHNKKAGDGTPIPKEEILKLFKVRAIFKAY